MTATATSRGSPSAVARRCSSATPAGTSPCSASSPPRTPGTSGGSTTATRPRRCTGGEGVERYAGWPESLLRLFAAADTWYKWALYDRDPIPQWTRGRVTVLGDAAHPMLPYLGQGACQAIEDGAVLATALTAEGADPGTG